MRVRCAAVIRCSMTHPPAPGGGPTGPSLRSAPATLAPPSPAPPRSRRPPMNRLKTPLFAVIAALLALAPTPAPATDVDGPDDCQRVIHDMGDAPEAIPCYPGGVIGKFPTCFAPG